MHRFTIPVRRIVTICSLAIVMTASHVPVAVRAAEARTGARVDQPGYTLQVAAFERRADADALVSRIEGAWVQETRKEDRIFFRVNYRRFDERSQAVRAQWDLEDLGFKSFIQELFA